MFQTPITIKDVEFTSYLRPSERHGHPAVLQLSFRLTHMQQDEMILSIQQDQQNRLFTNGLDYYNANDDELISLTEAFDEEEMHELLKAVLNDETAQKELVQCGMNDYNDCYAKKNSYDFEVIITHAEYKEGQEDYYSGKTPEDRYHRFYSKEEAYSFFSKTYEFYKRKSISWNPQSFGSYKATWQEKEKDIAIVTHIFLYYQGIQIKSEAEYKAL